MSVSFKPHRFLAAIWVSVAVLGGVHAGSATPALGAELQVPIDEAALLRVDRAVADVIIGNPAIADVTVRSRRLLVFTGKSFGATNVIVLDSEGSEITNQKLRVNAGSAQTVSLHKGTARQSYACNPDCRPALVPGDDPAFVEALATTTRSKFGVVQSVLDESGAAAQ